MDKTRMALARSILDDMRTLELRSGAIVRTCACGCKFLSVFIDNHEFYTRKLLYFSNANHHQIALECASQFNMASLRNCILILRRTTEKKDIMHG
jgi:hypothetical protein